MIEDTKEFDLIYTRHKNEALSLQHRNILITGGTGLVGRYLVDFLCYLNDAYSLGVHLFATGRNSSKFDAFFGPWMAKKYITFLQKDITQPIGLMEKCDYIIHLASNASPNLYASEPIETELTCIVGTKNILDYASECPGCRVLYASSGDVYGDPGPVKKEFSEQDFGYVDCNKLRSVYTEGKRAAEALCQAYLEEKKVDFVTARLCRIYGPTLSSTDNRGISEFLRSSAHSEPIILKSAGTQIYSYAYVGDIVAALVFLLAKGETGQAYNVANNSELFTLRDLATLIASFSGSSVHFAEASSTEKKGYNTFQGSILNVGKISGIGFSPLFDLRSSLFSTFTYLGK